VGHQDNDLELRALLIEQTLEHEAAKPVAVIEPEAPAVELPETPETPAGMDDDEIGAWRKTARYFRKAA
jgi:hypothetical protein